MVSEKNDSENFLAKKIDNPLNEREKIFCQLSIMPIRKKSTLLYTEKMFYSKK
jgi:hypothetical protein